MTAHTHAHISIKCMPTIFRACSSFAPVIIFYMERNAKTGRTTAKFFARRMPILVLCVCVCNYRSGVWCCEGGPRTRGVARVELIIFLSQTVNACTHSREYLVCDDDDRLRPRHHNQNETYVYIYIVYCWPKSSAHLAPLTIILYPLSILYEPK